MHYGNMMTNLIHCPGYKKVIYGLGLLMAGFSKACQLENHLCSIVVLKLPLKTQLSTAATLISSPCNICAVICGLITRLLGQIISVCGCSLRRNNYNTMKNNSFVNDLYQK